MTHDLSDGRQETHVEHPIRFVENQELQPGKISIATLHQIQQPSRTRDNNIRVRVERAYLRMFPHAAEHRGDCEMQMLGVSLDVLLDLDDEFARRRDDEHARAVARAAGLGREFGQHGQRECRRLARASLSDTDEIVPRNDRRDSSSLNRSRLGVTGILHRLENFGIKT